MTAAQRLRLVLALGVVNVILATVALSVGIAGLSTPPSTASGPGGAVAVVSPAPSAASTANPTPRSTRVPATSTPGGPAPSTQPSVVPTVEPTTPTEPSMAPSPEPSSGPSILPSAEPTIVPAEPPVVAVIPRVPFVRRPVAEPAAGPIAAPAVPPNPTPGTVPVGAPDLTGCPVPATKAARAAEAGDHEPDMTGSSGRACGHDKIDRPKADNPPPKGKAHMPTRAKSKVHAPRAHDRLGGKQPATVEQPRRLPKSGHRLRGGRGAR